MEKDEDFFKFIQAQMQQQMHEQNSAPREEMDNLSANDMQYILYHTFDDGSPIGFKNEISSQTLSKVSFLNMMLDFFAIIERKGELKLTAKGNLPRKVCFELYEKGYIKERYIESGFIKLNKEGDSISLQNVKNVAHLAGLTKKRHNKLSLTQVGKRLLLKTNKTDLLKKIFITNCQKYNLGYHDLYGDNGVQRTFGYTIYLLLRYGKEERDFNFYVDKNIEAFPVLLDDFIDSWSTPKQRYNSCYWIRVFVRFLCLYGFIDHQEEKIKGSLYPNITLKATPVFYEIFEIKKQNFRFRKEDFFA